MNIGLLTTPLAYLNYQKKKAAYDAALTKYESLKEIGEAAVEAYQEQKSLLDDIRIGVDEDGNINEYHAIEGLDLQYTLYVGALAGKKMSIGSELVITNNTDETLRLLHIETEPTLIDVDLAAGNGAQKYLGYSSLDRTIDPGKSVTVRYGYYFHVAFLSKDEMSRLRYLLCREAGKKLITSVPYPKEFDTYYVQAHKGIQQFVSVDVNMHRYYKNANGDTIQTQYRVFDVPGKLVYMGEAWNPGLWDAIKDGIGI